MLTNIENGPQLWSRGGGGGERGWPTGCLRHCQ
jgi:hypothetical protein